MDIRKANSSVMSSNVCLGADNVLQLLKNYCRNNGMKTSITVGVIGYPNVGKSSLILGNMSFVTYFLQYGRYAM